MWALKSLDEMFLQGEMEKQLKAEKRKVREDMKKSKAKQKQSAAAAKLQQKLSVAQVEITRLKEQLAAICGSTPAKPTRETMVERREGKGNPVRDSVWERRSRQQTELVL